jgi:hypothetical protein
MANSIINPAHVGRSIHRPGNKIYGASIKMEEEVLKILHPKGGRTRVRKELMEAVICVVSLPGKSALNDESQFLEQLTGNIGDLNNCSMHHHGRVARTTHWGTTKVARRLGNHRDHVLTSMHTIMRGVLCEPHWSEPMLVFTPWLDCCQG